MIGHLVVKLVTPAMIGGAVARECDTPPSLRPPSVRGHLRFWSRALKKDLDKDLWGDEERGQRVGLLGIQPFTSETKSALLIRSKSSWAPMIPPGEPVLLRFSIPSDVNLQNLQAVLWAWLHLGTVGRRSRRGYGSLQWLPSDDDLLTGWPRLWPNHHLHSKSALEGYLKQGLTRVGSILGQPDDSPRASTTGIWELRTQDQVFVGKEIAGVWQASSPVPSPDNLEHIVHGLNEDFRGTSPDRRQLGFGGRDRLPSPIMWRFFPVPGSAAFRPVMTWFPTGYASTPARLDRSGKVFNHLSEKFGFKESLTGGALAGEPDPSRESPR